MITIEVVEGEEVDVVDIDVVEIMLAVTVAVTVGGVKIKIKQYSHLS